MWPHKFQCIIALIICSFSFSSTSYGISEEFLRIISNTTLEQEQTYEAEKKIIANKIEGKNCINKYKYLFIFFSSLWCRFYFFFQREKNEHIFLDSSVGLPIKD